MSTKNAQHTPGPWRFVVDGEMDDDCNIPKVDAPLNYQTKCYCNNPFIIGADGEEVVGCSEYNVFAGPNQAANVALMIAAPDLLAALVKAETWLATYARQVDNPIGPLAEDLREIRAAIAKATNTPNQ